MDDIGGIGGKSRLGAWGLGLGAWGLERLTAYLAAVALAKADGLRGELSSKFEVRS
jgi:hypothetical protein